ncbi:MAG: hypothetical protein ACE5KV_08430 [Thermoplasmata archaeon]
MLNDDTGARISKSKNKVEFIGMADKGKLIFEESRVSADRKENASRLRRVIGIRVYLTGMTLGLYAFLVYLLIKGTLKVVTATLFILIILTLLSYDILVNSKNERSARAIMIYENGINMPATWFEKSILGRGFVPWDSIQTVFSVKYNIVKNEEIVRGVDSEIVVITKDGVTHCTGIKDEIVIQEAVSTISQLWPQYSHEKSRMKKLKQENPHFSERFASLDSSSLVSGMVIVDVLLLALIGIAIMVGTGFQIMLIFVVYLILLDLLFAVVLVRVNTAKIQLIGDGSALV